MARKVTIKLLDGSEYVAHQSTIDVAEGKASDDSAHALVQALWEWVEDGSAPEALILQTANGEWTSAHLNHTAVAGIFLTDPGLVLGAID